MLSRSLFEMGIATDTLVGLEVKRRVEAVALFVVVDHDLTVLVVVRVLGGLDCEGFEGQEVVKGLAVVFLELDVLAMLIGGAALVVVRLDGYPYVFVPAAGTESATDRGCQAENLMMNVSVIEH